MKRFFGLILILFSLFFGVISPVFAQSATGLLSPAESLWLQSRNNTIVVYPSENSPPYSYKNAAGNPEGLSIDFLQLIAQKVGAQLQYLTPRPLAQVLDDVKNGTGDVIATVTPDPDEEQYLIFTDNYVTSPSVIVVRKDYNSKAGLNLDDFDGKRVAVVDGSALEAYMRVNYPQVVIEEVTDNEVALQQVVLGETDAAAMDVASLSYFLSKQVLNSVKVVGDTGFQSEPAFGMPKNDTVLQSILEKGMSQITTSERDALYQKWVSVPTTAESDDSFWGGIMADVNLGTLYILFGIAVIVFLLVRRRNFPSYYARRAERVGDLKDELSGLKKSDEMVAEELEAIRRAEDKLEKKIDSLAK